MDNHEKNSTYLGIDVSKLKLIGQGRQGKVYLLSDTKVIKVCYKSSSCRSQLEILQKGQGSRFFPTIFDYDNYSIIMSFIDGITLSDYLKRGSLGQTLSLELAKLIEKFENLQFTRLDIRICHILVQNDNTIKIIDPRGSYKIIQPYPMLMMKGLKRNGVLIEFLDNIKNDYPNYYSSWVNKLL